MIYINWKYCGVVNTVDEFKNVDDAKVMLKVYQEECPTGYLWTSSVASPGFKKNKKMMVNY